jgi:Tol biopolymer transport system component
MDVGLAVVNRSPGTGFELVDLKRKTRHVLSERGKDATISPDGSLIAFVIESFPEMLGREELWLMKRDDKQSVRVAETGRGAYPSWSRDGRSLYFYDPQSRAVMFIDTEKHRPAAGGVL